jgi:hypothetical protein
MPQRFPRNRSASFQPNRSMERLCYFRRYNRSSENAIKFYSDAFLPVAISAHSLQLSRLLSSRSFSPLPLQIEICGRQPAGAVFMLDICGLRDRDMRRWKRRSRLTSCRPR